jgi:hypothetical protein
MPELVLAVLVTAAYVYCTSAVAKLRGRQPYRSFRAGLGSTALVPARLLPVTAGILVGCEATVAAGLAAAGVLAAVGLAGAATVTALALGGAALLTGVLAVGIAVVIRRGTAARCACFGMKSGRALGVPHLTRNIGLLALVAVGLAADHATHGRPVPAGIAVAAVAGVVTGLLLTRFDELVMLFTPISRQGTG